MLDDIHWILVLWCGILGGVIGSFMNVVVYRWPRGMSVVRPGSHCPSCGNDIRWFHNVPVLGWLILRGRCFDCGAKISPRYPLVEALVVTIFAVLAAFEVITDGDNLPGRFVIDGDIPPDTRGIYAYHLLLLCSLTCAALIEWDDQIVPVRLIAGTLVVGLAAPIGWHVLHPLAGGDGGAWLVDAFLGALAGLIMRTAAWPSVFEVLAAMNHRQQAVQEQPRKKRKRRSRQGEPSEPGKKTQLATIYFPLVAVGVFLGWQAAVAVGCGSIVLQGVAAIVRRLVKRTPSVPLSAWQMLATLAYIITWQTWVGWLPALGVL